MAHLYEFGKQRYYDEGDECDYAVKRPMSDWLAEKLAAGRKETKDEYILWMRRTGQ